MARRISDTLRRLGSKTAEDNLPAQAPTSRQTEYDREDEESDHDRYRRRQQRMADQDTMASLPIKRVEEEAPPTPKPGAKFEGPIEKLVELYGDPREVIRHMTVGQYMRYELRDGQIWEGDKMVYDGTGHVQES